MQGQVLREEATAGNWECYLAAGLELTAMRNGDAEVFVGIYGSIVDAHFVMKMWTGGTPAESDIADRIATMNVLAGCNCEAGQMAITRGDAVAMIHHYELSVPAHEIRKSNYAIRRRDDGMTVVAANIDAAVECAFAVEGIDAFAEAGGRGVGSDS